MTKLPPDLQASLRFMDVSDVEVDMDDFPTFLIAGPQRTGSTWLYTQIESHPQILITNPKEVYYFHLLKLPDHPQHWTDDLGEYLKLLKLSPSQREERNRKCMQRFNRPFEPLARGDATASYAVGIDDARIAEMLLLAPDLRVVTMVRNPIDRAWSHAKLIVERVQGRAVDQVPPEEIERILRWQYHIDCGMYCAMYDRWTRLLKPGNLFFRAFDEIISRPTQLLLELLEFLGVDADERLLKSSAKAGANSTDASPVVPPRFAGMLHDVYDREIEALRNRFGIGIDW